MLGASGKIFRIYHLFSAYGTESLFSLVLVLLLLLLLSFFCLVSLRFAKGVQKIFCIRFSKEEKNPRTLMNTFLALLLGVTLAGFFQKKADKWKNILLFILLLFYGLISETKKKTKLHFVYLISTWQQATFLLFFVPFIFKELKESQTS